MGLIREPKNIDFTVRSKPWTAEELRDFRKLMAELKSKNKAEKLSFKKAEKKSKRSSIKNVDYIGGQGPLIMAEEKELSEYFTKQKLKTKKSKRSKNQKNIKRGLTK